VRHAIDQVLAAWQPDPVSGSERGSLARQAARGAMLVTALAVALALAYLVKSALRIDILPGPSPLHDLLYPIIERLR
jgi:hypothetical protein